jgi:hypothetical protein
VEKDIDDGGLRRRTAPTEGASEGEVREEPGLRGAFYRAEGKEEGPTRRWGSGARWLAMNGPVAEPFRQRKRRGSGVSAPDTLMSP